MKKIICIIVAAVLLLSLAACGGGSKPDSSTLYMPGSSESGDAPATAGTANTDNSPASPENVGIYSVVHPDFSLTNGFIEPVEQQSAAPEGYIPISTAHDFDKIRFNTNANYILMSDIDLSETSWDRIDSTFSGILDGNGFIISGFNDTLFGHIEQGIIKNLGVSAELSECSAAVAQSINFSTLRNCYFEGSVTQIRVLVDEMHAESGYPAAGLVERASNSAFISCYNAGDITAINLGGAGIVVTMENGNMINCFNSGNIISDHYDDGDALAGGLVASARSNESLTITYCFNNGTVTSNGDSSGIAGNAYCSDGSLEVIFCYNSGSINGFNYSYLLSGASGICGAESSGGAVLIQNCYNKGITYFGICGSYTRVDNVFIQNCYNTGPAPDTFFGGAISNGCKNLANCYFFNVIEQVNATPDGALFANVSRLSADQALLTESYEGFDFDNHWQMGSGDYPYPVFKRADPFDIPDDIG